MNKNRFVNLRFTSWLASLSFGLFSIAAVIAILLLSDLDARKGHKDSGNVHGLKRIALVQHASLPPLDEGIKGVLAGLASRGFVEGKSIALSRYNAQGDLSVANAIAAQVTNADFDLIITASTPSLQTVANANRSKATPSPHVFGITSDPYRAGVNISRENHLDHPPYMAGIGSMAPIRELFELLRTINPNLHRIGLVWNPTESNSEAATLLARAAAVEFGMELIEGNAESSTVAGEVAQSVIARGVDVFWVSPDITVYTALDVISKVARSAGIPLVTSLPGSVSRGSLLDLGARYEAIGYVQGLLTADVLDGRDTATIPVENWIPVDLNLNLNLLDDHKANWHIGSELLARASLVIDASGTRKQELKRPDPPSFLHWDRSSEQPGA